MPTPRIEIEYCTQCRWLLRAAWLAQELLTTFDGELGEVALVPGTGGRSPVRRGIVVFTQRGGPVSRGQGSETVGAGSGVARAGSWA